MTSDIVKQNLELYTFIFQRDPIESTAQKLATNSVVAFSTYVWNRNYNFTLAKRIKELNPDVFIVFGGPEPPITKTDVFSKYMPWCNVIVRQEGEVTLKELLEHYLTKQDIGKVAGLLINENTKVVDTGPRDRIDLIDDIPSPYLSGLFDQLLVDYPDIEWNCTLETNRGCPYQCTFCDWGSLTYSKIKKYNLERVYAELEWVGKNKISYIDLADANFGIFPERDNLIADKLIATQQTYGYPYRSSWSWAKNQKSDVIQIAKKIGYANPYNNGLTISLQTMDEGTLKTVKRSNLAINQIHVVFDECKKLGVPLNTELILGLPGETKTSWANNLYSLLELGQHDNLEAWQCQLLENAEMNLLQRKLNGINTVKVLDYLQNSPTEEVFEYIDVVTDTNTMSKQDMVESFAEYWYIQTWHMSGFSQLVARFIRRYCDESYADFYSKFKHFLANNKFWQDEYTTLTNSMMHWLTTGERIVGTVGDIDITAITFHYQTIYKIHYYALYEQMYQAIEVFVDSSYNIPDDIKKNLYQLNRQLVAQHGQFDDQLTVYQYNLLSYLHGQDLITGPSVIKTSYPHDKERSKDLRFFIESIYFARRRSFGKNFLETIE
jgi:tRNA A37 methylthiotransferase MiaB